MDQEDIIGEQAEKEYEEEQQTPVKKPRAKPLSLTERLRILNDFRNGRADKFYDCKPDPKHPGEFKVIKRRKPLDIPEFSATAGDVSQLPPPPTETPVAVKEEKPKEEKKPEFPTEYFNMQSSINNNLSKEIAALQEKYKKLSQKLKEERARKKNEMKMNPQKEEEYEYEYVTDDEDEEPPQPPPQSVVPQYVPYVRRRQFDIRNF